MQGVAGEPGTDRGRRDGQVDQRTLVRDREAVGLQVEVDLVLRVAAVGRGVRQAPGTGFVDHLRVQVDSLGRGGDEGHQPGGGKADRQGHHRDPAERTAVPLLRQEVSPRKIVSWPRTRGRKRWRVRRRHCRDRPVSAWGRYTHVLSGAPAPNGTNRVGARHFGDARAARSGSHPGGGRPARASPKTSPRATPKSSLTRGSRPGQGIRGSGLSARFRANLTDQTIRTGHRARVPPSGGGTCAGFELSRALLDGQRPPARSWGGRSRRTAGPAWR